MKSKKVMTREDVCEYLGVCKATVTRWVRDEGFPSATRKGRTFIWKLSDIENWIYRQKHHPSANAKFRNHIERLQLRPDYQPPEQGLEKLKKIAQKAQKTLFTRQELAEHLQVSIGTINRWIRSDNFPQAHNLGNNVAWKLSEVEDWVMIKKCTPSSPHKALTQPEPELLTISPAFEQQVLQGVIDNISAAVLPKIQQELAQTTDKIINKVAKDLLNNYGK